MIDGFGRITRVLALAVVLVLVLSAVPMFAPEMDVTQNAAAAEAYVKVGVMQDFEFWNPLNLELVSDYVACYLMFSVLFQYNQDWEGPINDLATGYTQYVDPVQGNMSTYITITQNAYFRNIEDLEDTSQKLTANDVKFTIDTIKANPGGAWDDYLKNITEVRVVSEFQVCFETDFAMATLIDNLVWIPILPQYQWSSLPGGQILTNKDPDWLIGSGPFVFNNSVVGSWYRFDKAPNYHGSTDYPSGDEERIVDFDGIQFSIYTDASGLVLDMNSGILDVVDVSGSVGLYLDVLDTGSPYIEGFSTSEMGIIDVALNAIPMDFRTPTFGDGNPLLLDPLVRKAILMTMDRDRIVNDLFRGLPTAGDSVLSTGFWHNDVAELPYDPAAAKTMLLANGYEEGTGGTLQATATAYPVEMGWADEGDPLSFRLRAPDTDPTYDTIASDWPAFAELAGIDLVYEGVTPEKTMIAQDWYKANYDIWVWAWYWSPEPLSNLAVWLTDQIKPGGNNCQMPMGPWWYSAANSSTGKAYGAFDENWTAAQKEQDLNARKVIVDKLQQWIYDSWTETPPIYPTGLYAVSTKFFTGWGNWSEHLGRSVISDLPWVWFDLVPTGANAPPEIVNDLQSEYTVVVGSSQSFSITVRDPEGDPLTVNWDFGDGQTATDTITTGTAAGVVVPRTHLYDTLATAGLDMVVNISDPTLGNYVLTGATVYVIAEPDSVPTLTYPILSTPADKAYIDELVTWTAGAKDLESGGDTGPGLKFTWVWDDGTYNVSLHQPTVNDTQVMDTVMHAWSVANWYAVELWVDDMSGLPGHNVSMAVPPIDFEVVENQPPALPSLSPITVNRGIQVECLATSSDADGDSLLFTWIFEDGTTIVTEGQAAPDELVVSTVNYTWTASGSFLVEVYVDDQTGEPGHNVTSSITAEISNPGTEVAPSAIGLIPVPATTFPGDEVVFNASAIDTNSDPLTFYITYDDGMSNISTTAGGVTTRQSVDFVHTYADAGVYVAELWVDDGTSNVSVQATVTVTENSAPQLMLPVEATALYNRTFTVTPARVSDADGDVVTVWYDWGDGNESAGMGPPTYSGEHAYEIGGNATVTVYADDGTGLAGHNVSATMNVTINENLKPQFWPPILVTPDKDLYDRGETVMFTICVRDYEGDTINITIDFDDGTDPVIIADIATEPKIWLNKTVNYTFEEGRDAPYLVTVTVDDGMIQYRSSKTPELQTVSISVEPPESSNLMLYVVIGVVAAIVVLLVVWMLMRKKKSGEQPQEKGGMEGMAPPPPPKA